MLQLARASCRQDPDEAKVRSWSLGSGHQRQSFEFERDGEYKDSDLDELRAQLRGPGWSRIVGVRSRRQAATRTTQISPPYRQRRNQRHGVLVAEPRELTIVSILGSISPDDLRDLTALRHPRLDGVSTKKGSKED